MSVETSFEIVNRKNIEAMKDVIRFERERTTEATKMAQNALNNCVMLQTEIDQLRQQVHILLMRG
jgi:predicted transcriptional regulator